MFGHNYHNYSSHERSCWLMSRGRLGSVEERSSRMSGARIAVPLGVAVALAVASAAVLPHAYEAERLISIQDDPVALADHAVTHSLNSTVAEREIKAALAAKDVDLAQSFVDLARDNHVAIDASLSDRVRQASAEAATLSHSIDSFAHGLFTGEPDDLVGLAGTAVGDLFVFGDIRDAAREGSRLATGQQADELILGLAGVGLAVTAGTYVTVGLAAPARLGLTVLKAAGKTGRMGGRMAVWIGRSLREIVDWGALSRAVRGASIAEPAVAVRATREVVKAEKARDLVRLAGDVGRVQMRAGTQAALDGLRLAEGPRDMSRIARLAAAKGGKTRAILKLAGRGAILLAFGAFNLATWVLWALLTLLGLTASLKRMTERVTQRYCLHRRIRRARAREGQARADEACASERRVVAVAERLPSPAPELEPMVASPSAPVLSASLEPAERLAIQAPPWPALTFPRRGANDSALDAFEKAVASLRAVSARAA
jgi:hypothetical protein